MPICLIYAVVLVSQGMIQNFRPYDTVKLTEPFATQVPKVDDNGNPVLDTTGKPVMEDKKIDTQTIAQGPMASQVAIKMLGTNGGGFLNVNAAHPYENPTPFSNFLQMLSIFAIPSAPHIAAVSTHEEAPSERISMVLCKGSKPQEQRELTLCSCW